MAKAVTLWLVSVVDTILGYFFRLISPRGVVRTCYYVGTIVGNPKGLVSHITVDQSTGHLPQFQYQRFSDWSWRPRTQHFRRDAHRALLRLDMRGTQQR